MHTNLCSKDKGAVTMTRTVRSCSHRLWIWCGQSEPPAIMMIAEEGLELAKASGLSHKLHISCSTYSNTTVMSHLWDTASKQKRWMHRWKQKRWDMREYVRTLRESPPSHHDITVSLHSQLDSRTSWWFYCWKVKGTAGFGFHYKSHRFYG